MSQPNARANVSSPMPGWELVTAAHNHDEAAIGELIRRMNPRLFRVAHGIMPSDTEAEEVVQEAYLCAFFKLDSYRGEASFATWITRITVNAARMQLRRARPPKPRANTTKNRLNGTGRRTSSRPHAPSKCR